MKRVVGLTAVAVTAAGVVSSSGVASGDQVDWDAVAMCESSENWSANTGNGAYGGLQIKESTWLANGGIGSPAAASPEQQIQVAQRILATQGPGAWPTCMARGRDRTEAPTGTLTQVLTYMIDSAQANSG